MVAVSHSEQDEDMKSGKQGQEQSYSAGLTWQVNPARLFLGQSYVYWWPLLHEVAAEE